jgi:signal transduction histidine kinase/CheY-like chemotaxis protein
LFVRDVPRRFRGVLAGSAQLPVDVAVLAPLREPGADTAVGALVLGINPRLSLDGRYEEFLRVLAGEIEARLVEAHARERERQRVDRLAELDRDKTEFFSNVSHEFRTPLTLMLGPLEEMLKDPDAVAPVRRADLELIRRNARRLLRLVGTLLDFSQLEAGRMRARFESTDLVARTQEIVAQFDSAAEVAGLQLRMHAERLPGPVWVDREMWEKIVSNLVSNALKFTFEGEIEVSLQALPKHVELVVRDTGVGIPHEELPYVFKRFHRVRGTRARTHEGAGIGLALVNELVRRHQGRIRATSAVGEGTTFTVWIPRRPRPARPNQPARESGDATEVAIAVAMAEEAARWNVEDALASTNPSAFETSVSAAPNGALQPRGVGARLLVVDDNPDMRDYLTRLLASYWNIELARDGDEALQLARSNPPDLVVSDVMMPGLDGFGLLGALRAEERLASIPVILLTARAGKEAAIEGLLAGADDYIVKPFSARELIARVGAQLELARIRRHSDRRFRALANASWDIVYLMSPDWSEMRALDGRGFIADTESPSTSWLEQYIDPADQPKVLEAIQRATRHKTVFELEHRVRRPDGTLGWTLSRAVPILDENNEIIEWVGAATDITVRHGDDDAKRASGQRRHETSYAEGRPRT